MPSPHGHPPALAPRHRRGHRLPIVLLHARRGLRAI